MRALFLCLYAMGIKNTILNYDNNISIKRCYIKDLRVMFNFDYSYI